MTLELDTAPQPMHAALSVHPYQGGEPLLEHGFAVFLHKVLQMCGIVRLHGAAVECAGATHVFIGDKGAGKSTIALALGRAGGRVLADDQLVARRRGSQMAVSGCDAFIRLTEKSEQHFFERPLAPPPQDFAGVLKKEVGLEALASAIPFQTEPRRVSTSRVWGSASTCTRFRGESPPCVFSTASRPRTALPTPRIAGTCCRSSRRSSPRSHAPTSSSRRTWPISINLWSS
jgi:hypothetical protein